MKNVEIKAKVNNIDEIEKKVKELSDVALVIINQSDIFFHLPITQANQGSRLKLRKFEV
jgi:adenylate cyclase class IV